LPADSLIITTEKDRARLLDNPFITNELKEKIFYIEINVEIQNYEKCPYELSKKNESSRNFLFVTGRGGKYG